jgi:hypothetical protein
MDEGIPAEAREGESRERQKSATDETAAGATGEKGTRSGGGIETTSSESGSRTETIRGREQKLAKDL